MSCPKPDSCRNLSLGRLLNLEQKSLMQHYEQENPRDLIHIDVKKLGRFRKASYCIIITGSRVLLPRRLRPCRRCNDDANRLAYLEVLADDQHSTAMSFLCRAVGCFNRQGIECQLVNNDSYRTYTSPTSLPRLAKPLTTITTAPIFTCPA